MSRGSGRLTVSERLPELGNKDLKIYTILRNSPIWHAGYWQKIGELACEMPA